MSINKVVETGNLVRDPQLSATPSGTSVLEFSIAVNERINRNGQWEDYPNYFDCVLFGGRAESLSRFLQKGSKVAVEGRLKQNRWQDKESGQNRSKVQIIVNDVEFMSARNTTSEGAQNPQTQSYSQPYQQAMDVPPQPVVNPYPYEEDIPF